MPRGIRKVLSRLGLRKPKTQVGKWVRRLVPFALLLLVAGFAFSWVHKSLYAARFMELRKVEITGLKKVTANEIIKLADLKKGVNLLEIDLDRLVMAVLEHPQVRTVTLKKSFPNRLQIQIKERKPILQIYSPGNKRYYLVDQDGMLLPGASKKPFEAFLLFSDTGARPVPGKAGEQYPSGHIEKIDAFLDQAENKALLEREKITKTEVDEIGFWQFVTDDGIRLRVGDELGNLGKLQDVEVLLHSDVRQTIDYLDLRFKDVIVKVNEGASSKKKKRGGR